MSTILFRAVRPDIDTNATVCHLRSLRWSLVTGFLALSVAAAGAYAATASYARKQPTVGHLVPQAGAVRIGAPRQGILTELFVANGASVPAGAALFTVDFRQALQGGGTLDASVRDALDRQEVLLREQLAGEEIRAENERARLNSRIARLQRESEALGEQRQILERRVAGARARIDAVADLRRRGLITESDFHAREDVWLGHRQDLASLDQRITAIADEARQARLEREQLPSDSAGRTARLRGGIAELEQRKAEAAAQGAQIVRAPVAGRVTTLQAAVGQRVDPARPVLALVSEGAEMRAELFLPSRAIGFVRPGQAVRLMYDAFPYQRFGSQGGVVESVSEAMLAPDEVAGPLRPAEPSYRVTVRLDHARMAAFGRDIALQPDMTLRADIVLERRTLLQWLLEPLLSLHGRA